MADILKAEIDANAESAQTRFDRVYVTSAQIMKELGISRPALSYARKTGKLPGGISLNDGQLFIWERSVIDPYLKAWKMVLDARRGA
jgi:hypothetical protein